MNSTHSRISVFVAGVILLLSANSGLCLGFCWNCPPDPIPPSPPRIEPWFADGLTVTNPVLVITGYVSDATILEWRLENADGTNNYQSAARDGWYGQFFSAEVTGLIGGTNTVRMRGTNGSQLVTEVTSRVFFLQNTPVSVVIAGRGTVTPDLDGQILQSGSPYRMKAKPAKDSVFGGWTGGVTSGELTLNFMMRSNMVVQANFAPNPFRPAVGTYSGDVTLTGSGQLEGSLQAIVSRKGRFSARFRLGDKTYPLSGTFLADGSYSGSIHRKGLPNASITVQLQLDVAAQKISGTLTDLGYFWTGDVLATLKTKPGH